MVVEAGRIPIVRLRHNLVISIQTALSDRVVDQLKHDVTSQIEQTDVRGLVIDITGIDVMDSYITRSIRDIGLIARFMGVRTLVTGINPAIAMTLAEMGIELGGIETRQSLEEAIDALRSGSAS